jgi:nondiscriminating glutamyl-tRNA synthetase
MNNDNKKVITRFAPSPTGKFHVGGVRTALYNYLYARKHGGTFILRSEDTDPARSKKEYEDYFLDLFAWLGLKYDEFYRQSERTEIYKKFLEKLISEDRAYISKETPKEEGERDEVIRFRNPNTKISFNDVVLGKIEFDTKELGDFVIARSLESPLYHFTVVVDDFLMNITHIIRGQEHVSNTPRQILIQEAIGAPRPIYAHASIILNEERAKLSKRDPIVRPALEYKEEGFLPEALMNFMALLGWNPGTEQEIFTLAELVNTFSLERLQKAGAVFNPEKLEWINKEHIRKMSEEEKLKMVEYFLPAEIKNLPNYSEDKLRSALPIIIDYVTNFGMIREMAISGDVAYYFQEPKYEKELLKTQEFLPALIEIITNIDSSKFDSEGVKSAVWDFATEKGRGNVLWPMRFALSGRAKSPDPFTLAGVLGKEETLKRLSHARDL